MRLMSHSPERSRSRKGALLSSANEGKAVCHFAPSKYSFTAFGWPVIASNSVFLASRFTGGTTMTSSRQLPPLRAQLSTPLKIRKAAKLDEVEAGEYGSAAGATSLFVALSQPMVRRPVRHKAVLNRVKCCVLMGKRG